MSAPTIATYTTRRVGGAGQSEVLDADGVLLGSYGGSQGDRWAMLADGDYITKHSKRSAADMFELVVSTAVAVRKGVALITRTATITPFFSGLDARYRLSLSDLWSDDGSTLSSRLTFAGVVCEPLADVDAQLKGRGFVRVGQWERDPGRGERWSVRAETVETRATAAQSGRQIRI